jgi:hypothetical protein
VLRWREMVDLPHLKAMLQDRRVWGALLAVAALLAGFSVWAVRSYHRAQAREELNAFAPFSNPALDLTFPALVLENDTARKVLEPGVRQRIWTLHPRGGTPPSLEVRLTNEGQRWFSVVGDQIVATFKTGRREVTRILELDEIFPTRQVRYLYRWTELQPGSEVLGSALPEIGKEYEGEALFSYENGQWQAMHWTTPPYDQAVDQFRALQSASR